MATDGSVSAVVFHPFAAVVAVGDRSGSVSTWCSRSGTRLRTALNLFPVSALTMSPVTAMLAIGTEDGGVIVKDAHNERQVTRLIVSGRAHRVDSLSFSSCENYLALSCRRCDTLSVARARAECCLLRIDIDSDSASKWHACLHLQGRPSLLLHPYCINRSLTTRLTLTVGQP